MQLEQLRQSEKARVCDAGSNSVYDMLAAGGRLLEAGVIEYRKRWQLQHHLSRLQPLR